MVKRYIFVDGTPIPYDQEWIHLISKAKKEGFSIDEIRQFLKEQGETNQIKSHMHDSNV